MNTTYKDSVYPIIKMRTLNKLLTVTIRNGTSILSSTMLVTNLL